MRVSSAANVSSSTRLVKSATELINPNTAWTAAAASSSLWSTLQFRDHVAPDRRVDVLLAAQPAPVVVGELVALLRVHLDDRPVAEGERDVGAHQGVERGRASAAPSTAARAPLSNSSTTRSMSATSISCLLRKWR